MFVHTRITTESNPRVVHGNVGRVSVIPNRIDARNGGTRLDTVVGEDIASSLVEGSGTPINVFATNASPLAITGDT